MTLFVYGLDPAERTDYFGIVVHSVDGNMARLLTLRKIRDFKYPDVYRLLREDLFAKYPPYCIMIDYSNEKTFSEMLIEKYGKEVVDAINFTAVNKLMLKQDGLKMLQMGYSWPTSTNAQVQGWIDELRDQLKHEQMLETSAGNITFDHPEGEHNDLAIAWELSIHGCLKYILQDPSLPLVLSASVDKDYWDGAKSRAQQAFDKFGARRLRNLQSPGMEITDVSVDGDRVDYQ